MCMSGAHKGQKVALGSLELELQAAGSWGLNPGPLQKQQVPSAEEPSPQPRASLSPKTSPDVMRPLCLLLSGADSYNRPRYYHQAVLS